MGVIGVISPLQVQQMTTDIFGNAASSQPKNQPYILDLVTLKRIFLQSIPMEISVAGDSQFATVGTMARNNPFYHYTGAEEIVTFNVSWFAQKDDLTDVVQKCKWLKALSVNDGDKYGVHHVLFCFGALFRDSKYIVAGAPYKLHHFIRETNMLPCIASSEVTLRKIATKNETHEDIFKVGT